MTYSRRMELRAASHRGEGQYEPRAFPPAAVAVDVVTLTIKNGQLTVLLIERGEEPFKGRWALPGGFVRPAEDVDQAAERELREETGLHLRIAHLEQLGTYGDPHRDPRMRVFSVAYVAMVPDLPTPMAGTDARDAAWWDVADLGTTDEPALAFDHGRILADGLERVRSKLEYTNLALSFVGEAFTLSEVRRVYEAVWGENLEPANFRRKVLATPGFVSPMHQTSAASVGRPAELYRAGTLAQLHPPLLRGRSKGEEGRR